MNDLNPNLDETVLEKVPSAVEHGFSIIQDNVELTCGHCHHTETLWNEEIDQVLQADPGHPNANQTFYRCPKCHVRAHLILDRFEGCEAPYTIH